MRDYLLVIKGQFRTTWRFAILLGWFRKNIPWNSGDEAFHFETVTVSASGDFDVPLVPLMKKMHQD